MMTVLASRPVILGALLSRNNRILFVLTNNSPVAPQCSSEWTGYFQVLNKTVEERIYNVCLLLGYRNHLSRGDTNKSTANCFSSFCVCSQGRLLLLYVIGLFSISGYDADAIYSFVSL